MLPSAGVLHHNFNCFGIYNLRLYLNDLYWPFPLNTDRYQLSVQRKGSANERLYKRNVSKVNPRKLIISC